MKITLPSQPTPGVLAALQATPGQPAYATDPSILATAPPQQATITTTTQFPGNFVTSLVSQQAVLANNLTDTERIRYGVIDGSSGVTLGQLSQPGQSLKPGSGEFLQQLISSNPSLPTGFTVSPTMMTGFAGVTDSTSLLANTGAQISAINNSISVATAGLAQGGVITGAESPTQISGVVMAASLVGVPAVTDVLQNPATVASVVGNPSSLIGTAITAGTFAGGLADRITSGLGGVATSVSGLVGNTVDALSSGVSGVISGITGGISSVFSAGVGILQGAFAVAEQSFGSLKANVPNTLGGLPENIEAQPSKTLTATRDYEIANEDFLEAQDAYQDARTKYSLSSTEENLTELRAVDARVSEAKRKLSLASQALIGAGAPGLPGNVPGVGQLSTQNLSTVAAASASGLLNNPNPGNTGVNSIPGGLAAFTNIVGSTASNVLGTITGAVSDIASRVPGALATLTNPSALVGGLISGLAGNLGGIAAGLAGGFSGLTSQGGILGAITGGAQSAITGITSSISSALGSIGNGPGQIKVATLATNTYAKKGAVVAATLNSAMDPRVPPPSETIVTPSYTPDEYQASQSDAQDAVREITAEREVALYTLSNLYDRYIQTNDPVLLSSIGAAQSVLADVDARLAIAQTRYTRLVTGEI